MHALFQCMLPSGYGHLAVATATQCHIYSTSNFNTPHIFDLQQPLQLLLQCERSLLLCDPTNGMQVNSSVQIVQCPYPWPWT